MTIHIYGDDLDRMIEDIIADIPNHPLSDGARRTAPTSMYVGVHAMGPNDECGWHIIASNVIGDQISIAWIPISTCQMEQIQLRTWWAAIASRAGFHTTSGIADARLLPIPYDRPGWEIVDHRNKCS
jgi:hypothetical protein